MGVVALVNYKSHSGLFFLFLEREPMLAVFILSHFLEAVSVSDGIIPSLFLVSAEMAEIQGSHHINLLIKGLFSHTLRVFVRTPSSFFSVDKLTISKIFKFWFYLCLRIPSSTHFSPLIFSTLLGSLLCYIFNFTTRKFNFPQNSRTQSSQVLCHFVTRITLPPVSNSIFFPSV